MYAADERDYCAVGCYRPRHFDRRLADRPDRRIKITRMTPVQGCCASAGGAIMLFAATYLGIPVSTTHTVTGSVIGVCAARKASAVRWNIATNIVIAWIVTIPASALMAVLFYILSG